MRLVILFLTALVWNACSEPPPLAAPDVVPTFAAGGGGRPGSGSVLAVVDLGFTDARDIDEQGRVVGYDESVSPVRGVLWTPASPRGTSGSVTNLGTLGGNTYALGLNEAVQIAGGSRVGPAFRAWVWDAGSPHDLGQPAGALGGIAEDLSDPLASGERLVAGRADYSSVSRPVVWRVSGTGADFSLLGSEVLPGWDSDGSGQAIAVNQAGVVVGDVHAPNLGRPARWLRSEGGWSLNVLSLVPGYAGGQAFDVNAGGTAVGFNFTGVAGNCSVGVVWSPGAVAPVALPDLAGGSCSFAWAINNAGHVTGSARDSRGFTHAALWLPKVGGGYSALKLGSLKGVGGPEGRGLNEPQPDGSGGLVLQVVGGSARAVLWKVKLP